MDRVHQKCRNTGWKSHAWDCINYWNSSFLVQSRICFPRNDKRSQIFLTKNNIKGGTESQKRLLESIMYASESLKNRKIDIRKAENIICKAFRIENPKSDDNKWKDHHIKNFPFIFTNSLDTVTIAYVNGKIGNINGPILQKFGYKGSWKSLYEIVQISSMKKNMEKMENFKILTNTWYTEKKNIHENAKHF